MIIPECEVKESDDIIELKEHLHAECTYRMSDETMDMFVGLMSELPLKNKDALVPYGKFDQNIYIVKSGILRYAYFDGLKEVTFGFALPGTLIISYYSFYKREPSFFQIESCGTSVVMKVTKTDFDRLTEQSGDFAKWMLRLSAAQLWHYEKKLAVVNGSAKERFISLMQKRPEIFETVQLSVIASYIGITPTYLSKMKRQFKANSPKLHNGSK